MASRMDFDGRLDREAIYQRLHSFDHHELDETAFTRAALGLFDVDAATSAADLLAYHLAGLAAPEEPVKSLLPDDVGLEPADEILANCFTFYGERHELGAAIDWEHNPGTGHWGHDLNRFSFLRTLLQAFKATGDRRYAEKLVGLILDWIEKTDVCDAFIRRTPESTRPDLSRCVWSSYLNTAIHIEVWINSLAELLPQCPDLVAPTDWLRLQKSLHDQLWYLDLVIPETRGNWVTIGTRGQLSTLASMPGLRSAHELTTTAWERLQTAVADQIQPDGSQYELTPHYHMCVIRNMEVALASAPRLPAPPPEGLQDLFASAIRYIRHLVSPDGKLVAFNDSDPASGASVRSFLTTPRASQALGPDADNKLDSTFFPWSGVMILRQGSDRGTDELYLAFDGGPYGFSHQHEDALGFWLSAFGRSFIVDPGRHLYDNSSASWRPHLTSTAAHSTITIDGGGQQSGAMPPETRLGDRANENLWRPSADGAIEAEAAYSYGYEGVAEALQHTRRFTMPPTKDGWLMQDTLAGESTHCVTSRLQFAPGAVVIEEGVAHTTFEDANLAVFFDANDWDDVAVHCGAENPRQGWYSDGYNRLEPAPVLVFTRRITLPFVSRLWLLPYRGQELPSHLPSPW